MKVTEPNISAVIITDDNVNVIQAIESVYESVNEVILVNTAETDKVKSLVSSYDKVKYYYFKWVDDFSKARNFGIDKAGGDWILTIDSDEVMKEKICYVDDKYLAYMTKQYSNSYGSDKYVFYWTARLFQNHKGIYYKNRIHETIDHMLTPENCCNSNIEIYHSGYDVTYEDMQKKLRRNYKLLSKDTDNIIYNMHMGAFYFVNKNYETALIYFSKAMQDKLNDSHFACIQNEIHACKFLLGHSLESLIKILRQSLVFEPFQFYARVNIIEHLLSVMNDENKELYIIQIQKELDKIKSIHENGLSKLMYNEIEINDEWIKEKYEKIKEHKAEIIPERKAQLETMWQM